jgi:hypothetical protein
VTSHLTEEDVVSLETLRRLPQGGGVNPHALEAVHEWCRLHPKTFAGWVVAGSTLYVGFTGNAPRHLKALRRLVPTLTIRGFQAEHPYSDLLELVTRISTDLPALRTEGVEVAGVGISDQQNRVIVNLVRDEARWMAELRRRYGSKFLMFRITGRFYALPGALDS